MSKEQDPLSSLDLGGLDDVLSGVSPVEVRGRVTGLIGLIVKAVLPEAWVGELCYIYNPRQEKPVKAEVVGFDRSEALLMPLGDAANIGMASEVVPTGNCLTVKVNEALLGRVLNGVGDPRDWATKGPIVANQEYPVMAPPPDPLVRKRILSHLSVGIKAVDGVLTVGEGQRIGLFAAAGVGKSTFLGMIARNTEAEVNVIALIGERGREVNDFIEESLGEEGMARSVVVVATSDEPALVRLKAAYVAQTIADYFRDRGKKVMLMMDSVTRFARAQREVGLATGEPPARGGFTPSVFSELPRLLERAGNSDKGSITAFYTVLAESEDMSSDPVAEEVRSILDGHIILSRRLGARNHWPAVDVLESASRVMTAVTKRPHQDAAGRLRRILSVYEKEKDAISYGIYKKGTDKSIDEAIEKIDAINNYLRQRTDEKVSFDEALDLLMKI